MNFEEKENKMNIYVALDRLGKSFFQNYQQMDVYLVVNLGGLDLILACARTSLKSMPRAIKLR